mmetsp:Transcript_17043/g.35467  ORF Transcript_17043/g.35467 Transcript_17043/m.35467 type:complete len:135 (-) Transcript_17043:633-1037(-)
MVSPYNGFIACCRCRIRLVMHNIWGHRPRRRSYSRLCRLWACPDIRISLRGVGYWAKTGKRRGLQASSIAGLFAAFLDVAGFVFTLVSWDSFIAFVEDNAGDLLLNDSSIGTIESLKIILAAVFFALACIEVFR